MKTITEPSPITHTTALNRLSYKIPESELYILDVFDKRAREVLIKDHLGLVHLVAKKFWGMPYEDLVQEGCIGLLVAIERFDPERGYRFSTYALVWIGSRSPVPCRRTLVRSTCPPTSITTRSAWRGPSPA